ncbi:MAG: DUF2953 domain-containing protein [Lachnospiraceae bacterium]|nr:DUF2953 domain-containing protein [Lachnospiraceae bacterium]
MLHILLLILKIIGIILGSLLGLILLCLILALFVPVRYRADAGRTEGEGNPPVEVSAKITWLLHFINIRLEYSTEFRLRVRVFFFTVFRMPKKQQKETKEKNEKKNKKKSKEEKSVKKQEEAETKTETVPEPGNGKTENLRQAETATEYQTRIPEEAKAEELKEKEPEKPPKVPIKERIVKGITKIYQILKKIWYTITGICDKIKKIRKNIEYYVSVLQSDTFRKSFSLCKEELVSIFSGIRPRKFQADLIIGMDDPASTAKILSYYGMMYPFIGGNVNITPDFDKKRVEGFVKLKGKITLFTFIRAAVHIYFSKDIRKLLKLFKKEDV